MILAAREGAAVCAQAGNEIQSSEYVKARKIDEKQVDKNRQCGFIRVSAIGWRLAKSP